LAAAVAQIPMGRTGTPDEIASAALFLVVDENKYIMGQTIHVNGAWLNCNLCIFSDSEKI